MTMIGRFFLLSFILATTTNASTPEYKKIVIDFQDFHEGAIADLSFQKGGEFDVVETFYGEDVDYAELEVKEVLGLSRNAGPGRYKLSVTVNEQLTLETGFEVCPGSDDENSDEDYIEYYCPKKLGTRVKIDVSHFDKAVEVIIRNKERDGFGDLARDGNNKTVFLDLYRFTEVQEEEPFFEPVLDVGPGEYRLVIIDEAAEFETKLERCDEGYCPVDDITRVVNLELGHFQEGVSLNAEISVKTDEVDEKGKAVFSDIRSAEDILNIEDDEGHVMERVLNLPSTKYRVRLEDNGVKLTRKLVDCHENDWCPEGELYAGIYIETGYRVYDAEAWNGPYAIDMIAELLYKEDADSDWIIFREVFEVGGDEFRDEIFATVLGEPIGKYKVRFVHDSIENGSFETELEECDHLVYCPVNYPPRLCTLCDDVPSQFMIDESEVDLESCADTFGELDIETVCTADDEWVDEGYCRQSCYDHDVGYEGDECCVHY